MAWQQKTIRLEASTKDWLRRTAESENRSMSSIMRQAIREYLDREEKRLGIGTVDREAGYLP